ncbi:MAG: rod shape-determining protein [Deltaproteobacteria bacterium]|nr:rod shape-determining protein [Deltaproteobacteria bacterium]
MEKKLAPKTFKNVIGIDFGTTNTYVTVCPYGTRNKFPLHLAGKNPAIDTGVLYSDRPGTDPNLFPMIGEKATITFGQADPNEIAAEGYRYRSEFKPDIVSDPEARKCAADFFRALSRDAILNSTPLNAAENRVIIGAPSESDITYRQTLAEVAQNAGLGKVEVLEEPIGALLTELGSGRLALSDILKGYLVIDFGGGTCDFAFLRGGEVVRSWGELELGGRLFDDLFYRWFVDQNPGAAEKLRLEKREYFVRSYLCRNIKEEFSETLARNPKAAFKSEVGRFGRVTNLTRDEFIERTKGYQPTDSLIEQYQRLNVPLSPKLLAGPVDLMAWFGEALKQGLKSIDQIKAVSLSGGSSKWFFVKELCIEELQIDPGQILSSFNPFGAISEGLAILPAIQNEFELKIKQITNDKAAFLSDEIIKNVHLSIASCCQTIIDTILVELFDGQIAVIIKSNTNQHFTIAQMDSDIGQAIKGYEEQLGRLIDRTFRRELAAINATAYRRLESWLGNYGLKTGPQQARPMSESLEIILTEALVAERLAELLSGALAGAASALTATIVATVCGGSGLHLLAAGPAGLVAGAAGGLVLSGLGWYFGADRLKQWVKKQPLPGYFLKIIASDRSLAGLRENFGKKTGQQLTSLAESFSTQLSEALGAMIDDEIKNLGIINVF